MKHSKHNIVSSIKGTGYSFICNLLSGQADIAPEGEIEAFLSGDSAEEAFAAKGYAVEPEAEGRSFREAYLDFIDMRDASETQIFLVPWYTCNFFCTYCYQESYENTSGVISEDTIDAFYSYIDNEFKSQKKYITLFGGEPLLPGALYRDRIDRIVKAAASRRLELAVVTNGYHLTDYLDILSRASIREIQVTLDGGKEVHDARRPLKSGAPTFDVIAKGVTETLKRNIPVNLRIVADFDNIPRIHELVKYAGTSGWTKHPLFKTQIGRNYELHTCQANKKALLSRLEFAKALERELEQHPDFSSFYEPAFSVAKELSKSGKLPPPMFDGCPGCKTEWAFDLSGRIFSCTATVGKEGEALGRFYPDVYKDEAAIAEWSGRDVVSIPECRNCNVRLACGGGCGAVAKNAYGRLTAPDCRPVKELLELGIRYYFKDLLT